MGISASTFKRKRRDNFYGAPGMPGYGGAVIPPDVAQGMFPYGPPVYPPGYYPHYYPFPQPYPAMPNGKDGRSRKSSRRHSTRHRSMRGQAPRFAHASAQRDDPPEPSAPAAPSRARSGSRRSQTPFPRAQTLEDDENGATAGAEPPVIPNTRTAERSQAPRRSSTRRTTTTAGRSQSVRGAHGPPPLGQYDPVQFPSPSANPLPPPPKDVFEMTPYRHLLSLPEIPDLAKQLRTAAAAAGAGGGSSGAAGASPAKKSPLKKGLFGNVFASSSLKKSPPGGRKSDPEPSVQQQHQQRPVPPVSYYPLYMTPNGLPNFASMPIPSLPAGLAPAIPPNPSPDDPNVVRDPPIFFNQNTLHKGFLNHSPYRVIYEERVWPTATHLLEALKFMPHRMDIAEKIRSCANVAEVYPAAARFQQYQRRNWAEVYLEQMEMVLTLKIKQHPNLLQQLLETGNAKLFYDDPHDDFWGVGTNNSGANQLGRMLENVRKRLQDDTTT